MSLFVALVAPVAALPIGLATANAATGTFLDMTAESGFPLGDSGTYAYTRDNAVFSAPLSSTFQVFVDVAPSAGVNFWELQFAAPYNVGLLAPGTYPNVGTAPFQSGDQAGMRVTADSSTCDLEDSSFTVNEINIGPYLPTGYGRVIAFEATFEIHCVGYAAALTGSVRYEDPPDVTPPTIEQLPDITTEAEDSSGLPLFYNYPQVSDDIDPAPQTSCSPAYGEVVPIGITTVTCTATDYSGNTATMSFTVTVLSPLMYTFTIDSKGAVNTATGVATVGGTATCSRPGFLFVSSGTISQPFTKRVTLTGYFQSFVQVACGASPVRWTQTAVPPNGQFKGGQARVDVLFASACDAYRCFYFDKSRDVVLSPAKE
jgi:hypothetical protein